MNVLFLTPDYYPVWGGVGTYSLELSKNFPRDINLHIVTPKKISSIKGDQKEKVDEAIPSNVKIHYLGTAKDTFSYNLWFQMNCRKYVKELVKKNHIDIIHSQSAMPDLFISKKTNVPILTTIHTTIEGQVNAIKVSKSSLNTLPDSEKATILLSPLLKALENRYYHGDRHFITVSNKSRQDVIREKGILSDRIKVVYNGVDNNKYKPDNKIMSYKLFPELAEKKSIKVLYLSRMVSIKGINYLKDAMSEVIKKADVHFVFGGNGSWIKPNVKEDCYTYLGHIPSNLHPYIFGLCDIFILPSLYEGFPISLLEAMSSGCAVISTNVGGIPEMITNGKDGIIIRPGNSGDICNAIVSLSNDDNKRKSIGENARRTIEEKFNWRKTAKDTVDCYKSVIESYQDS